MYAMHGLLMTDTRDQPDLNDYISFGDLETGNSAGEVVFRNLRIRKAAPSPPSTDTENPMRLPEFREAVNYYPECPDARLHSPAL